MEDTPLPPELTMDQLFERYPQTMAVFVRLRFACIGCLMAPFDTLADVARNYALPLEDLTRQLSEVIGGEDGTQ